MFTVQTKKLNSLLTRLNKYYFFNSEIFAEFKEETEGVFIKVRNLEISTMFIINAYTEDIKDYSIDGECLSSIVNATNTYNEERYLASIDSKGVSIEDSSVREDSFDRAVHIKPFNESSDEMEDNSWSFSGELDEDNKVTLTREELKAIRRELSETSFKGEVKFAVIRKNIAYIDRFGSICKVKLSGCLNKEEIRVSREFLSASLNMMDDNSEMILSKIGGDVFINGENACISENKVMIYTKNTSLINRVEDARVIAKIKLTDNAMLSYLIDIAKDALINKRSKCTLDIDNKLIIINRGNENISILGAEIEFFDRVANINITSCIRSIHSLFADKVTKEIIVKYSKRDKKIIIETISDNLSREILVTSFSIAR